MMRVPKVVIALKPGGHASLVIDGMALPVQSYKVEHSARQAQHITITLLAEVIILPPEEKETP